MPARRGKTEYRPMTDPIRLTELAALPWHLGANIEDLGDREWMWRSSAPFCASCFEKPTAEVAAQMVGSASCGIASAILIPSAGLTTIGGLQRGCWGPRDRKSTRLNSSH